MQTKAALTKLFGDGTKSSECLDRGQEHCEGHEEDSGEFESDSQEKRLHGSFPPCAAIYLRNGLPEINKVDDGCEKDQSPILSEPVMRVVKPCDAAKQKRECSYMQ